MKTPQVAALPGMTPLGLKPEAATDETRRPLWMHERKPSIHVNAERVEDTLRAIRALAELFGGGYSAPMENLALEAAGAGRPAYFSTAQYHNGLACLFGEVANRDGMDAAVVYAGQHYRTGMEHSGLTFMLGTLIPLGRDAADEIQHASGLLTRGELEMRNAARKRGQS